MAAALQLLLHKVDRAGPIGWKAIPHRVRRESTMNSAPVWAVFAVGLLSGAVTLVGGGLVLRFTSALDLLLGFSSGSIVGVALFDLLPEALDVAGQRHSPLSITSAVAVGFTLYLTMDRGSAILARGSRRLGHFAPAALTLHSFLDGLGIGFAFHISPTAGVIVAIGVLAHDLIDGAKTVVASLSSGASGSIAGPGSLPTPSLRWGAFC